MITKIPVPYIVRATSTDHGVDVIVLPGAQQAPEYWTCNRFTLALHQDGSHCDNYCGCMAAADEDMTTLTSGETLVIGEWTWQGARSWAVGWRRNGPTAAETTLLKRVDELKGHIQSLLDDLEAERGNHQVTRLDLAHNIRSVRRLDADLGESTALLVQLREGRDAIAADRDRGRQWILGLLVVNVVLAVALVWAVIA